MHIPRKMPVMLSVLLIAALGRLPCYSTVAVQAQVVTVSTTHRYLILVPGLCATVKEIDVSCPEAPEPAAERAAGTFRILLSALSGWMRTSGVQEVAFSYAQDGGAYAGTNTRRPISASATSLDSQVSAILQADSSAQVDIVAYSLGGVVAAYWAARIAPPGTLTHVRTLITLDSPLEGDWVGSLASLALGNRVKTTLRQAAGQAGHDLQPGSRVISAIRNRDSGAAARLAGRVYTIGNWRDLVVNAVESWLPGARANKDIIACATHDSGCHGTVLRDRDAQRLIERWVGVEVPPA
jgi:pimeloyl-ACP methyl ester carboxylesterase